MSARRQQSPGAAATPAALHHDPLADELESFYRPRGPASRDSGARDMGVLAHSAQKRPKPTHYKIVCISLYTDDIERLERMVETLKSRGHTKANKSQLIRAALDQVDLEKVPKSH